MTLKRILLQLVIMVCTLYPHCIHFDQYISHELKPVSDLLTSATSKLPVINDVVEFVFMWTAVLHFKRFFKES